MNPTVVRVRAQAHGGKYVGPNVATAPMLSVLVGGQPIIGNLNIPNIASGTVVPRQQPGTSPYPIVVQPPPYPIDGYPTPGTYWLLPPADGDADVCVSLDLSAPTQVEFRVTAFAPQPLYSSVTMTLIPGQQYNGQPGVVVPVRGLYVPAFTALFDSSSGAVNLQATVEMMCGCPITQQPPGQPTDVEKFWPSTEFEVTANFLSQQFPPTIRSVPLECTGTSQFAASPTLPSGNYIVWLSAFQPSAMNAGGAATTVSVP